MPDHILLHPRCSAPTPLVLHVQSSLQMVPSPIQRPLVDSDQASFRINVFSAVFILLLDRRLTDLRLSLFFSLTKSNNITKKPPASLVPKSFLPNQLPTLFRLSPSTFSGVGLNCLWPSIRQIGSPPNIATGVLYNVFSSDD